MGTSHPETKPWVVQHIIDSGCTRVLDVGAGAGNWLDALRNAGYAGQVNAVEVWRPYIHEFDLAHRYDRVFTEDVRAMPSGRFAWYDCVIFGDVLEHMTEADAVEVWRKAGRALHAAIAIPIVHYHQGPLNGNPHEVHVVEDWTYERVLDTFPGITDSQPFTVTGAYWR